jgi:hypothetical protein
MVYRNGVASIVALLALSVLATAQEAPEALLSADTQLYFRWDGVEAHRAAYEKTALGKMMQGDTGKFVDGVFGQLQDSIGTLLTAQQLLGGVPPAALEKLQKDAAEAPKLLGMLGKHGIVAGIEVRGLDPPTGQLTLIIPDAGSNPGPLFGTLRLFTTLIKEEVKEKKIAGRSVFHLDAEIVHVLWWVEGKHVVFVVGTDKPDAVLKRIEAKGNKLTDHPLYRRVAGFKEFETGARAFVDLAGLAKLAKTRGKEIVKLIDELGLDGLKGAVFYSGYDGIAERSLMELDIPGERKGLLRLAGGKPFKLSDVPPIPPDAGSWSMTNFELGKFYDVALSAIESIVNVVSPEDLPKVKEFALQADSALGINLRQDLFGTLGDKFVQYSSPSEGPLILGQTYLFKVTDGDKLLAALDQSIKSVGKLSGADVSVRKRKFHGAEVREVQIRQGFVVPTYVVHKGWLAVSFFPQPVHGFVMRANGELPGWQPDASVIASLEKFPKEFHSISVSDPRPTMNQILSLAPAVLGLLNTFLPDLRLEVGLLPNAQEATKHLFPNVSVVSDTGKMLRMETRASLALPFELAGLDTYSLIALFGFYAAARF